MSTSNLLFLPDVDPHAFFEKEASVAKMPDDDQKWPSHILSELYKQLPFLSKYDVDIAMQRVEPEAGFAFGHATILSKNDPRAATESKNTENIIRIPLIVADRLLQPFHTFEIGGQIHPVTAERIDAAMMNPALFDGPANQPKTQKSMVDQLYPPYQQRQGFGRVIGGAAAAGIKTGSAPADMSAGQLSTLSNLKRTEKQDAYMRGLSSKERAEQEVRRGVVPTLAGAAIGATKGAIRGKGGWKNRLVAAQGGALAGATTGAGIAGINSAVQAKQRNTREGQRAELGLNEMGVKAASTKGRLLAAGAVAAGVGAGHTVGKKKGKKEGLRTGYVIGGRRGYLTGVKHGKESQKSAELEKEAMVPLNFDAGRRIPSNMVMQGVKIPLAPGIVPMDLFFFPVPGTKFVVGVHKTLAKKLGKIKNQQKLRQALAGPMRSEIRAARSNRRSPGLFLLLSKEKKGYRYHKPKAVAGLA